MQPKLLIWDFNGTILDDMELCLAIENEMLLERGMPTISKEWYLGHFSFPIRAYYEMNKQSFYQNDIMKAFFVVVSKGTDAAAAKKLAESLYNDVIAKKVTCDELKIKMAAADSGFQAGDMFISKNSQAASQLGITYQELLKIFTRAVGNVSEIKETSTDFQFNIVRTLYPSKLLELSDVVQPESTTTVYEYIRNYVSQQKWSEYFNQATQEVCNELRTSNNYQMMKTGSALDSLLEGW